MQRHYAPTQMPPFFLAYYDCTLRAVRIPGVLNIAADAISRTGTPPNSPQHSAATRPSSPTPMESTSSQSTGLDVGQLENIADQLCEASLASSSSKTYKSTQRMYTEFCTACGREPLPTSEQLLILFVAELSLRVCHSTARTYLAAVRHMHISRGYRDPLKGCPRLELVLRGLKRQRPRAQDSRLPVTPLILLQIKKYWPENLANGITFYSG